MTGWPDRGRTRADAASGHDVRVWLTLEKSGIRNQRRDLGVDHLRDPHPDLPARQSLVLTSAHTLLPEAGVEGLPGLARQEVMQGLSGPVREAMARCEDSSPAIELLRDDLVLRLSGGRSGLAAAVVVVDQVHLRRLVRGVVPTIIATRNLLWYDFYRHDDDPHAETIGSLRHLHDTWRQRSGERSSLEEQMRRIAVDVVGEDPDDLLDAVV